MRIRVNGRLAGPDVIIVQDGSTHFVMLHVRIMCGIASRPCHGNASACRHAGMAQQKRCANRQWFSGVRLMPRWWHASAPRPRPEEGPGNFRHADHERTGPAAINIEISFTHVLLPDHILHNPAGPDSGPRHPGCHLAGRCNRTPIVRRRHGQSSTLQDSPQ